MKEKHYNSKETLKDITKRFVIYPYSKYLKIDIEKWMSNQIDKVKEPGREDDTHNTFKHTIKEVKKVLGIKINKI